MSILKNSITSGNAPLAPRAVLAPRSPLATDKLYDLGQVWINTATDAVFTLTSFAAGVPNWEGNGGGGGGAITGDSITITPGPSSFTGEFRVDGDVNEAEVIKLSENGGVLGTVIIESLQGTDSGSIHIQSVSGGIEVVTDAAGKDIVITSDLGRLILQGGEDVDEAAVMAVGGGTSATLAISNLTGTTSASSVLAASIHIASIAGGIGILSGKDLNVLVDTVATLNTTNGDLRLIADAGDVIATATLGDVSINSDAGAVDIVSTTSSSWTGADSINIFPSDSSFFTVTGASKNLNLSSVGGSVIIDANEAVADAIIISPSGASGGIQIAPLATVATIAVGDIAPSVARTTSINTGTVATAVADVVNVGTGATSTNAGASKTVNIATGNNATGSNAVNIATGTAASGSQVVAISTGTGGGTKTVTTGNVDGLTTITQYGVMNINTSTSGGATTIGNAGAGGAIILTTNTSVAIDSKTASHMTVTGAAADLTLSSAGGSVNVLASEAVANAVRVNASDAAGGIDVDAGTGGIAVDTTGSLSLDSAAASNVTITGAFDLTVNSTLGSVVVQGGEAVVDAIQITATNAAGGLDLNAGSGGVTVDTTGAFSIDGATASNVTVTGAAQDLTLASSGGSVNMTASEAAANAIRIQASDAAGGIDIDSGTNGFIVDTTGAISLDSAAVSNFTATGAFDLTVNTTGGSLILTGGEAVVDAVQISSSAAAGGVAITSGSNGILLTGGAVGAVSVANVQVAGTAGPSPTVSTVNNARVGSVTYSGYTQSAGTTLVVSLTNSFIGLTSAILATATNVGANDAQMNITRIKPAAGSAEITIINNGAAALNGNMVLSFWVLS